jgi:hypothetical protein
LFWEPPPSALHIHQLRQGGAAGRPCGFRVEVLRSWRVIIIRSKGEYLGSVEAPDRERAEAVAIKHFALDDDQRRRLLIRERL